MALIDVIKYDGNPNIFAWKYPNDRLNTSTQLIVSETQEANDKTKISYVSDKAHIGKKALQKRVRKIYGEEQNF